MNQKNLITYGLAAVAIYLLFIKKDEEPESPIIPNVDGSQGEEQKADPNAPDISGFMEF